MWNINTMLNGTRTEWLGGVVVRASDSQSLTPSRCIAGYVGSLGQRSHPSLGGR